MKPSWFRPSSSSSHLWKNKRKAEMVLRSMLAGVAARSRRSFAVAPGESPSDVTRRQIAEWVRERKRKLWMTGRMRRKKKDEFFVPTPESSRYLDTITLPMVATAVALVMFSKLMFMNHESTSQERLERKIQKAPAGQGTVRMLSREEWEQAQEIRPRTPFESKLARPNARLRTGDPKHMEDVKNWSIDVFMDALTRAEETAKHNAKEEMKPLSCISCKTILLSAEISISLEPAAAAASIILVVNVAAVGTSPLRIMLSKTTKASSSFPYWQSPLITILSETSVGTKPNVSTSSLIWKAPCNYSENILDINPTTESSKKHIKRRTIRCNTFQVHLLQKLRPNVIQQSTLVQTHNQRVIC